MTIPLESFVGEWVLDSKSSTDDEEMLKEQGVSMFNRKMGKGIPLWIVHSIIQDNDITTLNAKVTSSVPFVNFDYKNNLDGKSYTVDQSGLGQVIQCRWRDETTGDILGTDDSVPGKKPEWHCKMRWTIENNQFVKYLDFESKTTGFKKQLKLVHNRK